MFCISALNTFLTMTPSEQPTRHLGVLTLHYGYNEGAILQAMALTCLLEDVVKGANAGIIDHRYPGKVDCYGPPNDPRKRALAAAIDTWLPLSQFHSDDPQGQLVSHFCKNHLDGLVIGSDVVWELCYTRRLRRLLGRGILPRQINPFFPSFPNVYWPDNSVACPRVAYAACCGNLLSGDIPRSHRRKMAEILEGFAGIGVRDERTRELVATLAPELGRRAELVPDPTIAFNLFGRFDGSTVEQKLCESGVCQERPKALLIMSESPLAFAAACELKRKGYQVVATGKHGGMTDVNLLDVGLSPLEWAWMPRYFGLCVTERMHATIFCLLNRTPFLALDMNTRFQNSPTKLEELIDQMGLADCCLNQQGLNEADMIGAINRTESWDYAWPHIEALLDQKRNVARSFLERSLACLT